MILKEAIDPRLWSTTEPVVFFPVRHHSPACARLVAELIRQLRPSAVLIEGPADFNSRLDELLLDHELPLAIYSYFRTDADERCGAFYPLFEFSPEWVALRTARDIGAVVELIDLPWVEVAPLDRTPNRYSDGPLGRSSYTEELCRRLGVDDWDSLWDTLFEIDPELGVNAFMQRCHSFCYHARVAEGGARAADRAREAYMLERIRAMRQQATGAVLVVTGGFHSSALFTGLHGIELEPLHANVHSDTPVADAPATQVVERGLALTPYSFERLDAAAGYDAGLPHPGFYHRVWCDRSQAVPDTASYRALLTQAATAMRDRGQIVSTADLIGVESFAQALASMRGHAMVWRTDLVDALLGTLVKEELATGGRHPFLDALTLTFRGSGRGRLAPSTPLPPLVQDIAQTLAQYELTPDSKERKIELRLDIGHDLARSHILHRVRILGLPGFKRSAGTDFVARHDLTELQGVWVLQWSPDFEAACIELALYGASLLEAASARLAERAAHLERDAESAARLLLDASLAGSAASFHLLKNRVIALIRADATFAGVARALEHLYYLYRYDEFVAGAERDAIAMLLTECSARAIWLLEAQASAGDKDTVAGLRALLHAVLVAGDALGWDRTELLDVLQRVGARRETPVLLRGAAAGALWALGTSNLDAVLTQLPATPDALGDFLQGVFALAREEAQRYKELLLGIDRLLLAFDDEQFLVALPALRLAFTYFTPREKDRLARTLLAAVGETTAAPLPALAVSAAQAARALAMESRLLRELTRHGLRGGKRGGSA